MAKKKLEERLQFLEEKLKAKETASSIVSPWIFTPDADVTSGPDENGEAWLSPYWKVRFHSGTREAMVKSLAKLRADPRYQKAWLDHTWKARMDGEMGSNSTHNSTLRAFQDGEDS